MISPPTKEEALYKTIRAFRTGCDFVRADRRGSWALQAIELMASEGYLTTELYVFDEQSSELRGRPTDKLRALL